MQTIAFNPDSTGKAAMGGIKTGQVFDAGLIGNIVEGHNAEIGVVAAFVQRTQYAAPDAAIAIQCDTIF